jgi:hypothetical protein
MTRKIRLTLASILAVAALGAVAPAANAFVYWASPATNSIGRANNDGTNPQPNFITGLRAPQSIAVNSNFLYWTSPDTHRIGRANLDGSSVNQNFITLASNRVPWGVAVNSSNIFWTNSVRSGQGLVGRANLGGTDVRNTFVGGAVDYRARGIAVDGSWVYFSNWTAFNQQAGNQTIGRASLSTGVSGNSSSINRRWRVRGTLSGYEFLSDGIGINGNNFYWTNRLELCGSALGRGTLSGSAVQLNQSRLFLSSTAGLPLRRVAGGGGTGCPNGQVSSASAGLATDSTHLYWSVRVGDQNHGRGFISRANLNGSNPNQGFSPISINRDIGGLAIDDLSPAGSLRPSAFDFGDQLFADGPTAAKEFTLSSTGNAPLTIKTNGIRLTGEDADQFQITDGGDCQAGVTSLTNGQSCTVTVSFDPTSDGDKKANLQVTTSAGTKTSNLEGVGTSSDFWLHPFGHDFGNRLISTGASDPVRFTLASTGSGVLNIQSGGIDLAGDNPGQFRITGGTCKSATSVASGDTCTVKVAFKPSRAGSASARLEVETSSGLAEVDLDGTGTVDPIVRVNPVVRASGRRGRFLRIRIGCGTLDACTLRLTISRPQARNPILRRTVRIGGASNSGPKAPRLNLSGSAALRRALRRGGRLRLVVVNDAAATRAETVVRLRR